MKRHVLLHGPGLHRSVHIINKKIQGDTLKGFLKLTAWLIGCEDPCREHYLRMIEEDVNYDEQWTFRAHNSINQRLGKRILTWNEAENVRMCDFMSLMEPGVLLFLLYYSMLFCSQGCVKLFKSFFPLFLDEAPPSWREYYETHPIGDDFTVWMNDFCDEVDDTNLHISLDDVVLSYS